MAKIHMYETKNSRFTTDGVMSPLCAPAVNEEKGTFSVFVIGNPGAGSYSKKKLDTVLKRLSFLGAKVELILTKKKGDAETIAREALKEKPSLIMVAGGDGTINDVANSLAMSEVAVGILPMGSVNVLSREIGISKKLGKALVQILSGKKHKIPLGRVYSASNHSSRYFLLMADIGYGGRTVYGLNERIKSFSSRGAFMISGMKNLFKSDPDRLVFYIDGTKYYGHHAVIGKVSRYGGNFRVTPDASLENSEFFICIFESGKRIDIAKYALGVAIGRHRTFNDVVYLKCNSIIIDGSAHIQIDGNYFGKSPVKIDTIQNALSLVY